MKKKVKYKKKVYNLDTIIVGIQQVVGRVGIRAPESIDPTRLRRKKGIPNSR